MFTVEALKARHGDSLLLHAQNSLMLVDGGPSRVFDNTLRPRLKQLRRGGNPLKIDLMMISHIDDDHINGILELTGELVDATYDQRQPLATIGQLWHNSFSDGILPRPQASSALSGDGVDSAMALASLGDTDPELGTVLHGSTRFVLSSVRQGRNLRRDAQTLRLSTNSGFSDKLVIRKDGTFPKKRIGRFKLGVVGPSTSELKKLRSKWKSDLKKILKPGTPRVTALALASGLDTSVANLSSLVIEITASGKTALLTGDARGDMILDAMSDIGWKANGKWPVDLLKLPHHGSDRNVTREFFRRVPARHYVASGDGKHGNPEPETFDMILTERGNEPFTIHMTYGPEELKRDHEFEWRDFKRVMNRHDGWSRLRYPAPGKTSIKVKLA